MISGMDTPMVGLNLSFSIEAGDYDFGGRPVTPTHLLLLISEMEGTYQHLKYMGFKEDMEMIEELKKKYYKLYFQTKKSYNKDT